VLTCACRGAPLIPATINDRSNVSFSIIVISPHQSVVIRISISIVSQAEQQRPLLVVELLFSPNKWQIIEHVLLLPCLLNILNSVNRDFRCKFGEERLRYVYQHPRAISRQIFIHFTMQVYMHTKKPITKSHSKR